MARKKKGSGEGEGSNNDDKEKSVDGSELEQEEVSDDPVVKFPPGGKRTKEREALEENENIKEDIGRDDSAILVYLSLLKKKNVVVPNITNMVTLFSRHPEWKGVLRRNLFKGMVELVAPPPWHDDEPWQKRTLEDNDITEASIWLQKRDFQTASSTHVYDAMLNVGHKNSYHPVRDFLGGLPQWDGEERLTRLPQVMGADASPLSSEFFLRFMISAIARVMVPGCKADHVLVLVGEQDLFKSTALRTLVGAEFFSNHPITKDVNAPDMLMSMRGVWIFEMEEFDRIIVKGSAELKAFISRQEDTYRVPWGKTPTTMRRECVFIGTTNKSQFLQDRTGNRRYWTIGIVRRADVKWLEENREQVWAEAVARYERGEKWHIEDEALLAAAREGQEEKEIDNPWLDRVEEYVADGRNLVKSTNEIGSFYGSGRPLPQWELELIAKALKECGFDRIKTRLVEKGKVKWAYVKKGTEGVTDGAPEAFREGTGRGTRDN
jgi:predicted P-loop ATPase